ncbi:hypothetical protein JCM5350_001598 [Sporobolomyces pararoseus]
MDSNLISQLDQLSLGDSSKSFEFTFQLPPLAPSFPPSSVPPNSFLSLPPELISEIFKSFPLHPSSERNSTLASLCLVNHLFFELARPRLYRRICIDLTCDLKFGSSSSAVISTLTSNAECGRLVKELRVSFFGIFGQGISTVEPVLNLVDSLEGLEVVQADLKQFFLGDAVDKFVEIIIERKPHIQHLEFPRTVAHYKLEEQIFSKLSHLRTYIGRLPGPDYIETEDPHQLYQNVFCRLERLVLRSPAKPLYLNRLLCLSHHTLTALSFSVAPESSNFDLSSFTSLTLLRISISRGFEGRLNNSRGPGSGASAINFAHDIRNILHSVEVSPLQTLAIWAAEDHIGDMIAPLISTDMALSPSLLHFAATFPFLNANSSLLKAIGTQSLPHLERISILPECSLQPLFARPLRNLQEKKFKRVCNDLGIQVDFLEATRDPNDDDDRLDPYHTDSDSDDNWDDEDGDSWDGSSGYED